MYKLIFMLLFGVCFSASAQTIKKCQDAEGNWHYGDQAALECESSGITVMDATGTEVNKIDPPDTREAVEARQAIEEKLAEQERLDAEQQALDQRLLVTYEDENSIIRTRDALIAAIDSSIEADQVMKERLERDLSDASDDNAAAELRSQVNEFEQSIRDRLASKEVVRERYNLELTRYQELTKLKE